MSCLDGFQNTPQFFFVGGGSDGVLIHEVSPCFTRVFGLTAARAKNHEVSPCFTRVLGFDGGEGLNSRDAPVFYEVFGI